MLTQTVLDLLCLWKRKGWLGYLGCKFKLIHSRLRKNLPSKWPQTASKAQVEQGYWEFDLLFTLWMVFPKDAMFVNFILSKMTKKTAHKVTSRNKKDVLPIGARLLRVWPLVHPLDGLLQGRHVCQLHPLHDDEKKLPIKLSQMPRWMALTLEQGCWEFDLQFTLWKDSMFVNFIHSKMTKKSAYKVTSRAKEDGLDIEARLLWVWPLVHPLDGLLHGHHVCQPHPLQDDEKTCL